MEKDIETSDTSKVVLKAQKTIYKWDIIWSKVIILGVLHLVFVYSLLTYKYNFNYLWSTSLLGKTVGFLSAIGVTAGAHRLWAHKTYKANTTLQIILACMMSMTYQQSIYLWVRDHRLHHKFSETDADPHNAKRGFFFAHMGWLMVKKHPEVKEKGKLVDMSDLKANPVVMFQHKYYNWIVFFFFFAITTFVPVIFFGDYFIRTLCVTIYRYIFTVNVTWCVNSVAHLYGNKPYDKTIGPTENSFMKILSHGEGYHNYHHTFPHDYKAAELGGDTRNVTTMIIDAFAWLGWATDRQTASPEAIKHVVERKGDGTHSTYINNIKSILLSLTYIIIL